MLAKTDKEPRKPRAESRGAADGNNNAGASMMMGMGMGSVGDDGGDDLNTDLSVISDYSLLPPQWAWAEFESAILPNTNRCVTRRPVRAPATTHPVSFPVCLPR